MKPQETLIEAIKDIVMYNGYKEVLLSWLDKEKYFQFDFEKVLLLMDEQSLGEVHFIYMLCVLMFGDYGTSPNYGWIEDNEGFDAFIKEITDFKEYTNDY